MFFATLENVNVSSLLQSTYNLRQDNNELEFQEIFMENIVFLLYFLYQSSTIICCFSVILKHKWVAMVCTRSFKASKRITFFRRR